MKDINSDNDNKPDSFSDKPKRKRKSTKIVSDINNPIIPASVVPPADSSVDADVSQTLANILENTINKYSEIAQKQLKDQREDFDNLQPIISEFLDDFILIGHTIDGQRVVMRYTPTPADLDKLTELCKKVLVRMMIQEQNGN